MSIANDILSRRLPDFDHYLMEGDSLDDIDEYGFTPLIETVITRQINIAQILIERGVEINKPDVTGRTALHWAADFADIAMMRLLLENKANVNAYTSSGLSVLVYPLLRGQHQIKNLLYQYGANIDFALDFIYGKLLGHRFELKGDVDIVTAEGEFIELDYEGFILEFTVAIIHDSLQRFTQNFSTRQYREQFNELKTIISAFNVAQNLLQLQHSRQLTTEDIAKINLLRQEPLLILPVANRGHAFCFVRLGHWWAKIDRGENSLKEGCVNIYQISQPQAFDLAFLREFLYKKQPRDYFHHIVAAKLGLVHKYSLPMTTQIAGNCSWANIQAVIPVCYALLKLQESGTFIAESAIELFEVWTTWDQDRAIDECIQRFHIASPIRKASIAAMLAGVLFQTCDEESAHDLQRAEKILPILTLPDYYYILHSYINTYCVLKLTRKGNNLLKLLDDCGVNPKVDINPIATGLSDRERK